MDENGLYLYPPSKKATKIERHVGPDINRQEDAEEFKNQFPIIEYPIKDVLLQKYQRE